MTRRVTETTRALTRRWSYVQLWLAAILAAAIAGLAAAPGASAGELSWVSSSASKSGAQTSADDWVADQLVVLTVEFMPFVIGCQLARGIVKSEFVKMSKGG